MWWYRLLNDFRRDPSAWFGRANGHDANVGFAIQVFDSLIDPHRSADLQKRRAFARLHLVPQKLRCLPAARCNELVESIQRFEVEASEILFDNSLGVPG